MSKYIKLFENHTQYEAYLGGGEMILPNVSHCIDVNDVHYNPIPHDYSKDYLTFVALEDGQFSFPHSNNSVISYSLDEGNTWTELAVDTNNPTVKKGKTILWKGEITPSSDESGEVPQQYNLGYFKSTCEFDVQGNIMSLIYGDDFNGKVALTDDMADVFMRLFVKYSQGLEGMEFFTPCRIINAKNLILPATTLADGCYYGMFQRCDTLETAPELPATTLAHSCYYYMFDGCTSLVEPPHSIGTSDTIMAVSACNGMFKNCTSLVNAPELPSVNLAEGCYGRIGNWSGSGMFQGCTSLVNAPVLPATTLASNCYNYMFYGCTSLTTAPELPATTLAQECYKHMFQNCTNLTTAPELPATELAENCYAGMFDGCAKLTTTPELPATTMVYGCYYDMFQNCTSLTTAPELPATILADSCYLRMFANTNLATAPELPVTTLAESCYHGMFKNCKSMTTAPELPATTMVNACYYAMFQGCSNLNYIKCLATDILQSGIYYWLDGVASTGTFVKNSAATWTLTGKHGVPDGWTVQDAS